MRLLGLLLLVLGIGSIVVHLLKMEMSWLDWIGTWGEGAAWGIRGGFVALGLILLLAGKPKQSK